MTTASAAILTNSINSIMGSTGNIDIATTQTSGILNIGTNASRTGAINIGSTGSTGPIYIDTTSTNNTYEDPAMTIGTAPGTRTIRMGNITSTVAIGSYVFLGSTMNHRTITNAVNIANTQIAGDLNIGGANTRSGAINIGNGSGTFNITIHNAAGSTGSVNIASGTTQLTAVNIQSTTGTGTVTIGNTGAGSNVALNGAVTLARPLVLGATGSSGVTAITLSTQLGFRTGVNDLIIGGSSATLGSISTPTSAKSFVLPSIGVWFVELRFRTSLVSTIKCSLGTTKNVLSNDRLTVVNITAADQSVILSTTISEGTIQTWYIVLESTLLNAAFTEFYVYASRIG